MRHLTRAEGDRGAIALFAVVTVTALFLAIGLAVDGGAKIHAMQRADAIAAEAARTGAQRIIIDGNGAGHPTINPAEACSAAQAYVSAAQRATFVSCSLVNSTTIRVEAAVAYDNVFLSLVGPATGQENGSAQARLARGVGSEQ